MSSTYKNFTLADLKVPDSTPSLFTSEETQLQVDLQTRFEKYRNVNLSSLGASILACSDQSFALAKNLISDSLPKHEPDSFFEYGNVMDGWETQRHNLLPYDWVIIKLSQEASIVGVDIDTRYFDGNHAPYASLEAFSSNLVVSPSQSPSSLLDSFQWVTLVEKSALRPTISNLFEVKDTKKFNLIKLKIFPDGGVARLRIYTDEPIPKVDEYICTSLSDSGAKLIYSSNSRYSQPSNMLLSSTGTLVKHGWETRRRRVLLIKEEEEEECLWDGFECCIIKLSQATDIKQILVDTAKFQFNSPKFVEVLATSDEVDLNNFEKTNWYPVAPKQFICKDSKNLLSLASHPNQETFYKYALLKIYPDGGVMRFKVFGQVQVDSERESKKSKKNE